MEYSYKGHILNHLTSLQISLHGKTMVNACKQFLFVPRMVTTRLKLRFRLTRETTHSDALNDECLQQRGQDVELKMDLSSDSRNVLK